MSVTDTDLELLESYLDDELGTAEADALRKRLSSDPQLSAAMDELRSQREMRQQFFAAVEPDEANVQRLMQSVRRNVNREIVWAQRSRKLGMVGSLAACVLVGFFIGRASYKMSVSTPAPETPVAYNPPAFPRVIQSNVMPVNDLQPKPDDSQVVFDIQPRTKFGLGGMDPRVMLPARGQMAGYQVNVVDSNGNLIRRFTSKDQFDEFVSQQLGTGSHATNATWQTNGNH
jgi:hypothetical protein